ncbi:MAG: L-rhamnose mutarotase [Chloroflexota bacterium]
MPRIAFRLWLNDDPAGIETYVRWHLDPFDGLYDLIRAAGIERYTIWLDGTDLFLTREGAHPEIGEELDLSNPVHAEWAATMTPLFQPRVRESGAGRPREILAHDPDGEPGPIAGQMTYRVPLVPGDAAGAAVAAAFAGSEATLGASLRAAGVCRAWTFLEDGDAWIYLEAADLDAMEAALAADPAWEAFWAGLAPSLRAGAGPGRWRRTREVFRCD